MPSWRELYPFSSNYFELPTSKGAPSKTALGVKTKLRLHYVESNDAGDDPPTVLCVHGNPTWSFTYRSVLTSLRNEARVIAVDHIGCGLSDKPQEYSYSLQTHTDNLVQLIEYLDLRRIVLLVHDWGGAIGLGAGLQVLERIAGAVILNTAAFPPPYVPLRIAACRLPIVGNWAMRQLNLFALAALRMTLNRLPRLEPDVAAGLVAPYGNWHDRVAIARFVQDIPSRPSHATWQVLSDLEQSLPQLDNRPVHLVWGMQDWCFRPECLRRLQKLLPHAVVNELTDVGHYVMEEASDEVIAALRNVLGQL
jgi:cis-3-alkyl-4-acyloxetan-2-one decarboxylase